MYLRVLTKSKPEILIQLSCPVGMKLRSGLGFKGLVVGLDCFESSRCPIKISGKTDYCSPNVQPSTQHGLGFGLRTLFKRNQSRPGQNLSLFKVIFKIPVFRPCLLFHFLTGSNRFFKITICHKWLPSLRLKFSAQSNRRSA